MHFHCWLCGRVVRKMKEMKVDKQRNYTKIITDIKIKNSFLSNTDLAYELILLDILDGVLKSGEKINQESIAAKFNMSRTPIRDALIRLESEGFIIKNGKAGYNVYTLQLQDYADFYEFRTQYEAHAAYLAARNITCRQLEQLQNNLTEYQNACIQIDLKRIFSLDLQFHSLIVEASRNRYLIEISEQYKRKRDFYTRLVINEDTLYGMNKKHEMIFNAIKNCNEDEAKKAMESHLKFYIKNAFNIL